MASSAPVTLSARRKEALSNATIQIIQELGDNPDPHQFQEAFKRLKEIVKLSKKNRDQYQYQRPTSKV
ncbi:hypothetical protein VTN96DRAFT_7235 [Rasamsonia emersonii]